MEQGAFNLSTESSNEPSVYVAPGMPKLDMSGKQTSFFEFWPTWLIYIPVVLQSVVLAIWNRSLTLPLIANPKLPLSGMVGIGKSELLSQATGLCDELILDWFVHVRTDESLGKQLTSMQKQMTDQDLNYPVVCKPDIGCRGVGVKLVHNELQLISTLEYYPQGAGMMVQKLASWEPEAGVFYVRNPDEEKGRVISLALKYTPYVIGDGQKTLRQLIQEDARAGELSHLYFERHKLNLDKVIDKGDAYKLVFSASHCRGAIFRDGNVYISGELQRKIDDIMKELPDFYYGRLDIKFKDIDSLIRGENLEIVEINSASSESLHIWDRNTSFFDAISALLFQYRTLFRLGRKNRKRGYVPPNFRELLAAWKKERQLTVAYPETD